MRILFVVFLALLGLAFRLDWIGDHPDNFTPIISIVIFSSFYIKSRFSFLLPLLVIAISDFFIGYGSFTTMFSVYSCYILIYLLGKYLLVENFSRAIQISFIGSILFFVITNFAVWLNCILYNIPYYTHDLSGLINCYLAGIPFFKNTLISTLSFSAYFYILYRFDFNYNSVYNTSKTLS